MWWDSFSFKYVHRLLFWYYQQREQVLKLYLCGVEEQDWKGVLLEVHKNAKDVLYAI
jgi:hypothetical protein